MLTSSKQNFKFVNIDGVVYSKLVDGTSMAVKKTINLLQQQQK